MAGLTEAELAAVRRLIAMAGDDMWRESMTRLLKDQGSLLSRIATLEERLANVIGQFNGFGNTLSTLSETMRALELASGRRGMVFNWLDRASMVIVGASIAILAHYLGAQ